MGRRVGVGIDFDGEIKIIEAKRKRNVEQVRSWIVLTTLIVGVIALVMAASVGFSSGGGFGALQTVWNVTGPLFGAIVAYYFGTAKEHGDGKGRKD